MDMPATTAVATSIEASLASAGAKIATGGGVVSVLAFISSAQFVAFVGVVTAILGALITWYYKKKDSAQIQTESEERLLMQKKESEERLQMERERLEMDKQKHLVEMAKLASTIVDPKPTTVIETA